MKKKIVLISAITLVLAAGVTMYGLKPSTVQADSETKLDKASLAIDGITIDVPNKNPKIDKDTAIANAKKAFGDLANDSTAVHVEYQLVTNPHYELFSQAALDKNPDLKAKKHMDKTPAYIVTFTGGTIYPSQPHDKSVPTHHEVNVIVDATSGEALMAFSDK